MTEQTLNSTKKYQKNKEMMLWVWQKGLKHVCNPFQSTWRWLCCKSWSCARCTSSEDRHKNAIVCFSLGHNTHMAREVAKILKKCHCFFRLLAIFLFVLSSFLFAVRLPLLPHLLKHLAKLLNKASRKNVVHEIAIIYHYSLSADQRIVYDFFFRLCILLNDEKCIIFLWCPFVDVSVCNRDEKDEKWLLIRKTAAATVLRA